MHFFLLDVVDAGASSSFDWTVVAVLAVTILVEAIAMVLVKYNAFGKSLLDSFVVNAASIAAGYGLLSIAPRLFNTFGIGNLFLLLLITILIELVVLWLMNRAKPTRRTAITAITMNVITYLLFYLFIQFR